MNVRVRSVVCVVAITAIAALFALVSLAGTPSTQTNSGPDSNAVATARTTSTRSVAAAIPRGTPVVPLAFVVVAATAALFCAQHDRLIGRRQRRVRDVGHDWRSLLLGAPPALA
jgi:hypothetical protein